MKIVLTCLFSMMIALGWAQSPEGVWKTIDDNTGEARSHVEIAQSGNEIKGKVIKLLQKPEDTLCKECEGELKNKPVVGMTILWELEKYKDYWANGQIMDPESGNEYKASIWFEEDPDVLYVRGKHWTGLFRTQKWYRVE
ncbi:MAG TPA: DUF2147 domain-containing protein [Saprospiraceae bacterium]|nr:DUF2147 domain-containing protein [Saprospiraceae bacterium]